MRANRGRLPVEAAPVAFGLVGLAALVASHLLRPGWARRLLGELTMEFADRASPDLTWITDDLAIGGRILDDEWVEIARSGIRAVVDCRLEASDPENLLADLGIRFLRLPTVDAGNFTSRQVVEGASWIEQQWSEQRKVLVHCQAGKGRSVLMGGAALATRGMSPDDALTLIRNRRPIITPTPGQISRLRAFAEGRQLPLPLFGE